ncbi:MAG TPA: M14 family metallopeptidase [Vicinamibacterales bacterium]|nr:M14 family metallopeptidase [Vicinamibacterales bacterium]
MILRRLLLASVISAALCSSGALARTDSAAARPAALSDFFKPGAVLQDRNGDGAIDFVNARLVLASRPSSFEISAAADVAARLGFETSAMDLPMVRQSADAVGAPATGGSQPAVYVGAGALAGSGTTLSALGAGALEPGDGVVAAFGPAETPSVAIVGADESGLTAAAVMLGGHLPFVWDPKGPTVDTVAADVRSFLVAHGVTPASTIVSAVFVHGGFDEAERVVVDTQVASQQEAIRAQAALSQLKAAGAHNLKRELSYAAVGALRIRLRAPGALIATVELPRPVRGTGLRTGTGDGSRYGDPSPVQPSPRRPGGGAKATFDLSSFYSNDGALADSDNNLIPDRVDVLLSPDGDGSAGVVDLAARLGLESTGVSIPIAKSAAAITAPDTEPMLVLIGTTHPLVETLIKNGKWQRPALQPGEGLIQVVRKAFGEKSALIVTGGDAAGVTRAVQQLAEKLPHIWARGKDRTTLDDVEDAVRKFVAGRSPAGQAAMSLYKLDQIAAALQGQDLASVHVRVFAEHAADGLAGAIRDEAAAKFTTSSLTVDVQDLDVQKARSLVDDRFEIPSEVDEFWTKFRTTVVPAVKKRQVVDLEVRLSEPPTVRQQIADRARAELIHAGADDKSRVTVLSAYKQGYSWLYDVVRPALTGKPVDQITIKFAEVGPPTGWAQQGMFAPTRWLLEIYPIDEILAKELSIDVKHIRFEKTPIGSPAYDVTATDAEGVILLHQTFDPTFVERPFFDRFPDYEHVRVTTGWLKARIDGRSVADERIETDPERFWDHFQSKTLPALYDHVMALGKGKPRPEDAPFFGELTVDLTMSEPDYRIPVDQEQISSMEALHEEIYFNTLHFFDVMGRFTRGAPLTYPGRVIPIMHPVADGKPGHARISLTGFDAPRPSVSVDYVERNGAKGERELDIPKIAVDRPEALAATVRAGHDGIDRLDLRVKVDTDKDERDALIQRAADERVDRTIISAEQVRAVFANLKRLRSAGLYADALAFHDLAILRVTIGSAHDSDPKTDVVAVLDGPASPAPFPDIRTLLPAGWNASRQQPGAPPMVQWDTPIPPPEAYAVLAEMSTFKEATVYKVGESYLGKDVWAMDLMPPIQASHWSQAKATTLKPTVVYSARQHANEVSSTSHTLKLAELLLTDPAYREKLKRVNVVFHPITNPDGAQLAYDLQKITPNFMLHAGYLSALGVDVTAGQWDADPMLPESGIRPKIWRTWLPDIFLNPHGYPTHEWVQMFSEYAAWVRTRAVETRDYWTMRGWWMPGFAWLDDARYPRHKDEQMKLLDTITDYVKQAPGIAALNQRAYDRYRRYSFDFDQKNFKLDFTNGVLIYKSIKGAHASPTATDFMSRNPNVTIWDGSTEAPDETARGDWMKLVAGAGLQWDKAILDFLVNSHYEVERKVEPFWNGVSLTINRPRPPKPEKTSDVRKTTQQ